MSMIKRLFLGLFRKEFTVIKNVSQVTSQPSSTETMKAMDTHEFLKLSREKFVEIKSKFQSLHN